MGQTSLFVEKRFNPNAAWLSCKVFRRLTFGQRVAVVSSSGRVWVFA